MTLAPATHSVHLTPDIVGRCTVTLDGADITNEVRTLRVGPDGWAEVYLRTPDGKRFLLNGLDQVATETRTGNVELTVH